MLSNTLPRGADIPGLPDWGKNEELYAFIQDGVKEVFQTPDGRIPMDRYMGITAAIMRYSNEQVGQNMIDLLDNFLSVYLQELSKQTEAYAGRELLSHYFSAWDSYNDKAKRTNKLFQYINRHWVARLLDDGKTHNLYDVYTLHFVKWRDIFWPQVRGRLLVALEEVEQAKAGSADDWLAHRLDTLHVDEVEMDNVETPTHKKVAASGKNTETKTKSDYLESTLETLLRRTMEPWEEKIKIQKEEEKNRESDKSAFAVPMADKLPVWEGMKRTTNDQGGGMLEKE